MKKSINLVKKNDDFLPNLSGELFYPYKIITKSLDHKIYFHTFSF